MGLVIVSTSLRTQKTLFPSISSRTKFEIFAFEPGKGEERSRKPARVVLRFRSPDEVLEPSRHLETWEKELDIALPSPSRSRMKAVVAITSCER